jgi:hypothetical protein
LETLILFLTLVALVIVGCHAFAATKAYRTAIHYGLPLGNVRWSTFFPEQVIVSLLWLLAVVL